MKLIARRDTLDGCPPRWVVRRTSHHQTNVGARHAVPCSLERTSRLGEGRSKQRPTRPADRELLVLEPLVESFVDDPLAHPLARRENRINRRSSVLAIVPHYKCEAWLGDCLDSLVKQTHPLDGIAVVDDGSGEPPIDIV